MTPDLDDFILKIHAAPLEPLGWQTVVQELTGLCQADSASLMRVAREPSATPMFASTNVDDRAVREYTNVWNAHDAIYRAASEQGRLKPAVVSTNEQLIDRRTFTSSAYFNEYLRRNDLVSHLNVCLTGPQQDANLGASGMTLYRGRAKDPFSKETVQLLQHLAPHLSSAARTTWHIEALNMVEPMGEQALDEIRIPIVALDQAGKLALINSAAHELIRHKKWVTASGNSLVPSRSLIEADVFVRGLANLRKGLGTTLLLTDGITRAQAVMTTVPLAAPSTIQVTNRRIVGFVWIIPCVEHKTPVSKLGQLFDLTPAEIRLLQQLVDGESLRSAAERLHISSNTARTQLKVIFRKTGRHSQARLVALASRMATIRMDD